MQMEAAGRSRSPQELLEAYRERFEGFFLPVVSSILHSESIPQLWEPALYSLEAGGKRVRPLLVLACAGLMPDDIVMRPAEASDAGQYFRSLAAGPIREALFAGAAVECIHTYSLIHDDLPAMDDDAMRRGRPACHRRFPEWAALLAGDTLNTFAFRLLAESGGDVSQKARVLADAAGHRGMALGQALDLAQEKKDYNAVGPGQGFLLQFHDGDLRALLEGALSSAFPEDAHRLMAIHLHKTGALLRASCELGAICAGHTDPRSLRSFQSYGEGIGMLFQIVDDILDVVGDAAVLGKRTGKDASLGKLTFPGLIGLEASRGLASEICALLQVRARQTGESPAAGRNDVHAARARLLEGLAVFVLKRDR